MSAALELADQIESHRVELKAYCGRMLGSFSEAEDAVQETLLRAWRGADRFEGRAALRTWLYRIATNVCYDTTKARSHRAVPVAEALDLAAECPDPGPAERVLIREDARLALVAAVAGLPPRQRAVLVLRDVLNWHAPEVAELLGISVPAVNSALYRARATLEGIDPDRLPAITDTRRRALLAHYAAAFRVDDVDALTALVSGPEIV